MKDLIFAIVATFTLIFTTGFANHFVNEIFSLLFGIYCASIVFIAYTDDQ